jgi:hypothetical protein
MLLMVNCSSEDNPTEPQNRDFQSVALSGGEFEEVQEVHDVQEETVVEMVGNESFFCTTTHYDIVEAPDDFALFNPNAEIIWPGNLLQGSSLGQATPNPIPVMRGPGTIVMTILNGSPNVSRELPEVSLASVQNAMNQIISTASDTIPARFQFSYEEVHSWDHLALSLDVSVSYLTNSISASLDFSTDREYNRYVVQLYQTFFDMAFQIPTRTEYFFHADETADNLARFIQPGNPPAFISQVTYGRIFYMLIESTSESMKIDASLSASFSAGAVGGSMDAGATYISDLENVKIKVFALGGNQSDALQAITTDFNSLKSFLASGGQIRSGLPLSYVARSLSRPDQIVSMAVAANYDVTTCIPVGESFEEPIFLFRAEDPSNPSNPPMAEWQHVGNNDYMSRWNNILYYDDDLQDAVPVSGYTYGGTARPMAANGEPAVSFEASSGDVGNALRYQGLEFADGDFTVMVVARLANLYASYPAYILFGSSDQDLRNLKVGFADDSRLTMSTGNQRLDATAGVPLDQFAVYTFRFSQEDGMSIYVNLDSSPAASAASYTTPLLSYTDAHIGTSGNAVIEIAEIKAYGIAFHDAQREWAAEQLMIKYRL